MDNNRLQELHHTEEILIQYAENEKRKTLQTGRLASFIAIIGITIFIVQDIYILGFREFLPWRITGMIPPALFLILSFTLFKKYTALIIPAYAVSLTGIMTMMCGIIGTLFINGNCSDSNIYPASMGLVAIIFAVFVFAAGARRFLFAIIFLPLSVLMVTLVFICNGPLSGYSVLSNPLLIAFIVCIFSVYQEKINLRDFSSRRRVEISEKIISIQHRSMSSMLDSIDESAFLMKPDGTIVYANRTMAERLNTPYEYLPGMNAYDVTPQEVRESRREMAAHCMESKQAVEFVDERAGRSIQNSIRPVLDENNDVIYLAIFGFDITERILSENEIKKLLDEKKLLLKEVHHRIKNNMMSISSLLTLRSESGVNSESSAILKEMSGRVLTMMRIYDKLYRSEEYTHIHVKDYLGDLLKEISHTFIPDDSISILFEIEDLHIKQDIVFSIGIIINELVTNSLKYAFPDKRKGLINVSLSRPDVKQIKILIHDNGIGLPHPHTLTYSPGFGLNLVKIMVNQCNGTITSDSKNGTTYTITIPFI